MRNNLEELKEKYPIGTRIKLLEDMGDSQPIKAGEMGTVDFIDSMGSLHMRWDNGSGLAIIPDVDKFEIIKEPEKLKVIIIEPEKEPYVKEIDNTLKAEQDIVGGLIQCLPTMFTKDDSYDFIINDEGKLIGLPPNRYIYDKQDIAVGNMIVAKVDLSTGEFISIDDTQIEFLMKQIEEKCPKCPSKTLNDIDLEYDMEDIDK